MTDLRRLELRRLSCVRRWHERRLIAGQLQRLYPNRGTLWATRLMLAERHLILMNGRLTCTCRQLDT